MSDERECRCAHPEVLDDTALYRWPPGTAVTWCLDASTVPPSLSADDVGDEIARGISPWPRHCGVVIPRVLDPTEARVRIAFAPIDGPWNVLGETELPADGDALATHRMTLDSGEAWTGPWLSQVVMHEIGHALGLGHAPAPIVAVMSPIYNPALRDLQPWDVAEGVARYGEPAPAPPADPGIPTTPATFSETFAVARPGARSLVFDPVSVDFPEAGTYTVVVTVARAS